MLEGSDELGLADEPLPEVSVLGELGEQRLQGRFAPEDDVLGAVDDPHAALTEKTFDSVAGDLRADVERQPCSAPANPRRIET